MHKNNENWIDAIQTTAQRFIETNYANESSLFSMFWDAFSTHIQTLDLQSPDNASTTRIATALSFAQGKTLDLATPIVMATVADIFCKLNGKNVPAKELETTISQSAARFGAGPGLTASLVQGLPGLYEAVSSAHHNDKEAIVTHVPKPQYRIWTQGESRIVDSIEPYTDRKNEYLFWLDIDEKNHISDVNPKRRITLQSVRLLKYLVEHLGTPIAMQKILKQVFELSFQKATTENTNVVEQHITRLHKFCGDHFRQHLFGERVKNGLGLKISFTDKYFLYARLR